MILMSKLLLALTFLILNSAKHQSVDGIASLFINEATKSLPDADSHASPETNSIPGALGQRTSGARSAYPMTPFGNPFSLFNLFSLFRGNKSKLDSNGNLIRYDDKEKPIEELHALEKDRYFFDAVDEQPHHGYLKIAVEQAAQPGMFLSSQPNVKSSINPPSPVILVPGYGGSRLEAKLDKPSVTRYFCDHKTDWTDAWINVKLLLPYMIDCLIDNLRLEYDYATNKTKNPPGVEVRVKNSSSIASVEYLNDIHISGFAYFAPVINQLMSVYNYSRDENIRGAPYDFRKAPNELDDYFAKLKETSEQMFLVNKRTPITYICHSMGCNNMLYFLQHQPQRWKDTHVKRLISIAAPWGGSLSALRAAALGDDLGMPYLFSESKLLRVQRSLPSTIFLFPHRAAFPDAPLIRLNVQKAAKQKAGHSMQSVESGHEKIYTAHDFRSFFEDINHPDGYHMWLATKDLLRSLEAPGVEVWCLVGRGHKTLGRLEYTGEFLQSPSVELYDDGDGTVSIQSAKYCTKWSMQQEQPVHYREFPVDHMEALKDPRLTLFIQNILTGERPDMT